MLMCCMPNSRLDDFDRIGKIWLEVCAEVVKELDLEPILDLISEIEFGLLLCVSYSPLHCKEKELQMYVIRLT